MSMSTVPKASLHREAGKSLVILSLALLLLVSQSLLFVSQGNTILEQEAQQEAAGVVLLKWREVLMNLQDMETGQRGYLLTGTDSYLEPYRRAEQDIGTSVAALDRLAQADPRQQPELTNLRSLVKYKIDELDETVSLARAGKGEAALATVRQGQGKAYMDAARKLIKTVLDRVRAERSRINAEVGEHVRVAGFILMSIAATVITMVCVATAQLLSVIRANHRLSERLQVESTHDELTGLPNRRLLYSALGKALSHAARAGESVGLLFIDLDGFKHVNDHYGHEAGDAVLRAAAARFTGVVREADLLTRLGGDEFAVMVTLDASADGLTILAQRLLEALHHSLITFLAYDAVGASIGIAISPQHGTDTDALMRAADEAMYQAKRSGKRRFCLAGQLDAEPAAAAMPAQL
jgi:diguanylate cyclase (GGDEF)-like protein